MTRKSEPRRCKSCRKTIDPSFEWITGADGDYHVTCWNQLGNKKARKP